jgi:hypothetical protein
MGKDCKECSDKEQRRKDNLKYCCEHQIKDCPCCKFLYGEKA